MYYTPLSSRQTTPVLDPQRRALLLGQLRQLQQNQQHLDHMMVQAGAHPGAHPAGLNGYGYGNSIPPLRPPGGFFGGGAAVRPTVMVPKAEPHKSKAGRIEMIMNGAPHRAYLEAAQTVFKGEANLYLCDDADQPLMSSPVISFSLGSVGNLKVIVADKSLSLMDGDDAALLTAVSAAEALEWGEFLTASPMANRLVVRAAPKAPPTPPTRKTGNYRSPRLDSRGQQQRAGSAGLTGTGRAEERVAESTTLHEHPADGDDAAHFSDEQKAEPESNVKAKTQEEQRREAYQALCARATNIESRIRANSEGYCKALWDKEKAIVADCRAFRAKERRRVKAGYDRLTERLQAKEILPSERLEEEAKLNDWLSDQLAGINRIAARREERGEGEYEKFRDLEYSKLVKANEKLESTLRDVLVKRHLAAVLLGVADHDSKREADIEARRWEKTECLSSHLAQELDPKEIKVLLVDAWQKRVIPHGSKIMAGDRLVVVDTDTGTAAGKGTAGSEQEEWRVVVVPEALVLDRPFSYPHAEGATVKIFRARDNAQLAMEEASMSKLGMQANKMTKQQKSAVTNLRLLMKDHDVKHNHFAFLDPLFCTRVIQRNYRAYLHRKAEHLRRSARDRTLYLITKVQAIVRGRRDRRLSIALMKQTIQLAENMASFTLRLHFVMYLARWRRKRAYYKRVDKECLAACLRRRQELISLRKVQAVHQSVGFLRLLASPVALSGSGAGSGSRAGAASAGSGSGGATTAAAVSVTAAAAAAVPAKTVPVLGPVSKLPLSLMAAGGGPPSAGHAVPSGFTDARLHAAVHQREEKLRNGGLFSALAAPGRGLRRLLGGGATTGSGVLSAAAQHAHGTSQGLSNGNAPVHAAAQAAQAVHARAHARSHGRSVEQLQSEEMRQRAVAHFVALKEEERARRLSSLSRNVEQAQD